MRSRQLNRLLSAGYLALDAVLDAVRWPSGTKVLVACMPKSGSTSVTNAIGAYRGFRKVNLCPAFGRREQELCQIRLARYNHRGNIVAAQHLCYSDFTQALLTTYRLHPVVLVRQLPDVVMSQCDHLRSESTEGPQAFITREHLRKGPHDLQEAVVRLVMPWYLKFYAGWRESPDALFVAYEDLFSAPKETIARILRFAGIEPEPRALDASVDALRGPDNRFNVGVAGRGRSLGPRAAEALGQLLDLYPEFNGDECFVRSRETLAVALAGSKPSEGPVTPGTPVS